MNLRYAAKWCGRGQAISQNQKAIHNGVAKNARHIEREVPIACGEGVDSAAREYQRRLPHDGRTAARTLTCMDVSASPMQKMRYLRNMVG